MNRRTKEKRALLFGVEGGQVTVMEQQKEFIQEYLTRGKSDFKELCQKYGISEKTGHKCKNRFLNTVIRIWRPEQSTGKQPVKVG